MEVLDGRRVNVYVWWTGLKILWWPVWCRWCGGVQNYLGFNVRGDHVGESWLVFGIEGSLLQCTSRLVQCSAAVWFLAKPAKAEL